MSNDYSHYNYTHEVRRPRPLAKWESPGWEPGDVQPTAALPESARRIARECDRIKAFLVEKNLAYGNSALEPVRIFSSANTVEQLLVRIDDKLSRMQHGGEYPGDDTTLDLIGYLILLRLALKQGDDGDDVSA